jgi:hypothetical protein
MLTKIALAAALTLGTGFGALAASQSDDDVGGFRQLGSGAVVTAGVNPVYHRSLRGNAGSSYGYVPTASHKHATEN